MAVNLGLSAADLAAVVRCFGLPHRIRRSLRLLDLDHNPVEDVTSTFYEGQVNVNAGQGDGVSRSATISLYDPSRAVGLDVANAGAGVVSPRYLLEASRGMFVDELDRWVDIPAGVFWFNAPTRAGDLLNIEGQGKEALARYGVVRQLGFSSAANKMRVIRDILESIGETRFRLEPTTATMGKTWTLTYDTTPWAACQSIAAGMGRQLFYDAEGYVVCRTTPSSAVFTFRQGNGGTIRKEPEFGYSSDSAYNYVLASGATPQGQNVPIRRGALVASTHPMYLTRNGTFLPLRYDVSNDKLTTTAQVQSLANSTLASIVQDTQTGGWDSSPVWHLDEGDVVHVTDARDDEGTDASYGINVRMTSWSFPLTLGPQSNGANRRVARTSRRLVRSVA
jgi:hypothetical protein